MPARVDDFLSARNRGTEYNCLHFARDVWLAETGQDLAGRLGGERSLSEGFGIAAAKEFEKLPAPVTPCLVIMRGHRRDASHVGVYLRGRVLHLLDRAEYLDIDVASRGFTRLGFYR